MKKSFIILLSGLAFIPLAFSAKADDAENAHRQCSYACYHAAYGVKVIRDKVFKGYGGPFYYNENDSNSKDPCSGLSDDEVVPGSKSKDGKKRFALSNIRSGGSSVSLGNSSDCQCYYAFESSKEDANKALASSDAFRTCLHVTKDPLKYSVVNCLDYSDTSSPVYLGKKVNVPLQFNASTMNPKWLRQPTCGGKDPKYARNKKSNTSSESSSEKYQKQSESSQVSKEKSKSKKSD